MKKLQDNFTTAEQSKRLLELGIPADSADCYYSHYIKTYAHSEYTEILWHRPRFITEDNTPNWNARLIDGTQTYLPCWSVARLMEIFEICDVMPEETKNSMCGFPSIKSMSYMEYMMKCLTKAIKIKILDFSKLEE